MPPYHPRRLDAIQGADVSFLAEQQAKAELRRQRFATEAALPPPIPQPKRIAWPGGKIVTSDKREKLLSLLQRQSPLEIVQRLISGGAMVDPPLDGVEAIAKCLCALASTHGGARARARTGRLAIGRRAGVRGHH